jgi:hypothetical protein
MTATDNFAERIRARYPEGLTGAFAVGGTRTTYILEHNRQNTNPGQIADLTDYADYLLQRYFDFINLFLELGGQNMIITALGYQSFHERGEQYARFISEATLALINERSVQFYRERGIDPYFAGIDTLLALPPDNPARQLGLDLDAFQKGWPYQAGRYKVVWEIAVIPLFSFWQAPRVLGEAGTAELEGQMATATSLEAMYQTLYRHYARAAYGTELPITHFYLGTNRNGDMKLRSILPIAMLCGGPFRLFYTPYPTLFISRETLQAILEDLAFGKPTLRSQRTDYRDQYTSELAEAEYRHFLQQSADTGTVVGLSRALGET